MISSVDAAIRSKLVATSQISSVVSDRVFAGEADQGVEVPHIVFGEINGGSHQALSGLSGLAYATYFFEVVHETRAEVSDFLDVVKLALAGFVGTYGGVKFQEMSVDYIDPPVYSDELRAWRKVMFMFIQVVEERALS